MWENLDRSRPDSAHYSVMRKASVVEGMDALRGMFPDAEAVERLNLMRRSRQFE